MSLIGVFSSFLIQSGTASLKKNPKRFESPSDFFVENLDGPLALSFALSLSLLGFAPGFRLLGIGLFCLSLSILPILKWINDRRLVPVQPKPAHVPVPVTRHEEEIPVLETAEV